MQVGEGLGKPGRPYKVFVTYIGYFHLKKEIFIRQDEIQEVVLGDALGILPYGLWRSIEHMRLYEKALVMIKPKWGYAYEKEGEDIKITWP